MSSGAKVAGKPEVLYVIAFVKTSEVVAALDTRTWKEQYAITDGVANAIQDWVDANGNLYLANLGGPNITEYAPGATSPTFTYDSEMEEPVDVKTDSMGDVYEADQLTATVNEYAQENNTVLASCSILRAIVESVAVDKSGDVFVAYQEDKAYGKGRVIEYPGGLSGCRSNLLGVTVGFVRSIALDRKNDLVLCDLTGGTVDVVRPPYAKVKRTLGYAFSSPTSVHINKQGDRAYVADDYENTLIVRYPSGSLLKELGSQQGFESTGAAVDSRNLAP